MADPTVWSRPEYEAIARRVRARAGLVFAGSRVADAESGIRRAMAREGARSPSEYLARLLANEASWEALLDELTVGETYFFRDRAHFDHLRTVVVPELLARRPAGSALRFWSAGCASGEEPYSLAILAAEMGLAARTSILATDLSPAALAKARAGRYRPWSLRGVDDALLARYFRPDGARLELAAAVRARVAFRPLNLATDDYPALSIGAVSMDVILCRNVLIYLDPEAVGRVARGLFATLADGGWLLTGPSDPPLGALAPFDHVVVPDVGVFYRRVAVDPAAAPEPRAVADHVLPSRPPAATSAAASGPTATARALPGDATPDADDTPEAWAQRVRALANDAGLLAAERAAGEAVARFPLSPDLCFLRAALLVALRRDEAAAREARRALYLDRRLVVAHFLLGVIARRRGDARGARRAFRNALALARALPPDAPVRLGDGERAGRLVAAAEAQLAALGEGAAS